MELTTFPTAVLYATLALATAGTGVGILVYQTGATQRALTTRRANIVGAVLLILMGGIVLITQIWAIISSSYNAMG